MTNTTIYGLMAHGISDLYGEDSVYPCKNLFLTRAGAEAEVENFRQRLLEPSEDSLDCMMAEGLEIEIHEFTLCTDDALQAEVSRRAK